MFEKEAVKVACPKWGHESEENVGRLKTAGYTCPNCGDTRDAAEFARAIKEVEDAIEKLKGSSPARRKSLRVDSASSSGDVSARMMKVSTALVSMI